MTKHMRWTVEETEFLRAHYLTMPTRLIREHLQRFTSRQIWQRAAWLELGEKRVNFTPDGKWGAPPVKRNQLMEWLEQAGDRGMSVPELVEREPGVNLNTMRMRIKDARSQGLIYTIGVNHCARHFAASVPRLVAEDFMTRYIESWKQSLKDQKAQRIQQYRATEAEKRKRARALDRDKRQAERDAAAAARRAERDRRAKERAEARAAKREEQARAEKGYPRKTVVPKKAVLRAPGTRVTRMPAPSGPARCVGQADLSRAKITVAQKPLDRFAVSAPAFGGFSNLRPGEYAFEPASCAARAMA